MTLRASIADSQSAKQRSEQAYRRRLVEGGQCVKCTHPHTGKAQRCQRCTAQAAEAAWRRRQRAESQPKGPTPKVRGWNFETDDLITGHVKLARSLAWRITRLTPSSSTVDVDDMIGDAMYGLVVAGRTYDPSYNVPFGAWAATRIRGAIYDGMNRWTHGYMKQPPRFAQGSQSPATELD